jgi:hypothetical protein
MSAEERRSFGLLVLVLDRNIQRIDARDAQEEVRDVLGDDCSGNVVEDLSTRLMR